MGNDGRDGAARPVLVGGPLNALAQVPVSVAERYEAARRRNNYLRATPAEAPRPGGWKVRVRPIGGLRNLTRGFQGARFTAEREF